MKRGNMSVYLGIKDHQGSSGVDGGNVMQMS